MATNNGDPYVSLPHEKLHPQTLAEVCTLVFDDEDDHEGSGDGGSGADDSDIPYSRA